MRPALYLLASVLFDEPSAERFAAAGALIERLQGESDAHPWGPSLNRVVARFEWTPELVSEHARLFILGNPTVVAHPYGSYWLEGHLMGDSTIELTRQMETWDIKVERASGRLPDHIVAELEFIAYLAADDSTSAQTARKELLGNHLGRWAPLFTAALRDASPPAHPLYLAAADFLDTLIAWDRGIESATPCSGSLHCSCKEC